MRTTRTILHCILILVFVTSTVNISLAQSPRFILQQNPDQSVNYSNQPLSMNASSFRILSPLSTMPAIIELGGTCLVTIDVTSFDSVAAFISTAYEPVVDTVWLPLVSIEKQGTTSTITLHIPDDTQEELYNLTVVLTVGLNVFHASQPRAINVINHFSQNFSFVHITDLHVGDPRGFTENIRETIGGKSILRCIDEVNLLHPDFVIISGDLVFGQLYPGEYAREYPKCYEIIQRFDVPTYLCPGNHDGYRRFREDGLQYWEKYFGPLYYSFDYGDAHFQAVNSYDWPIKYRLAVGPLVLAWGGSIQQEQLSWIQQDWALHTNSTLKFMFMHHNPLWDTQKESFLRLPYTNRENVLQIINDTHVDMVLSGHVHRDNVTTSNGTLFLTTTTPESEIREEDGYWGYRLVTIQNNSIASYNYKEPKYSLPTYSLHVNYQSNQSAQVENTLDTPVSILLKFTLPSAVYTTSYGEIIQTRHDENHVELYLRASINAKSTVTITIIEP
ncbi:MAG: metallophosphoesterase [Methanobacteriota archaeon]